MAARTNITRGLLLGTTAIAALGLVACNSSNDGGGIAAPVETGELFPLGGELPGTASAMSADADLNTVRVADDLASVTLTELTLDVDGDIETFSLTLELPDGTSVVLTEEDVQEPLNVVDIGYTGTGVEVFLESADGTPVSLLIGLGLDSNVWSDTEQELAEDALFVIARTDPAADDPDFGVDTYLVTGNETDSLPTGSASYYGESVASIYRNGALVNGYVTGDVSVHADFDDQEVDIDISGSDGFVDYSVYGNNLPIDGSGYGGTITGEVDTGLFHSDVDVAGDLLGAFFGDGAEATAGVFGANETAEEALNNNRDVEIVGAFGAYEGCGEC